MTGKPFINVAYPDQTPAEAADQALAKWAALQIFNQRRGLTGRHTVDAELNKMDDDKQLRARHWLNHYRAIKPEDAKR